MEKLEALVGTTDVWYLFVLYSFRMVASGLHPQIHKGVRHTKRQGYTHVYT